MMFKVLHKWLALLVFLQLLTWLLTGFLLGKVDHNLASGGANYINHSNTNSQQTALMSINEVLQAYPLTQEIVLLRVFEQVVYKLTFSKSAHAYQKNEEVLINAVDGSRITLDKATAIRLAMASYQAQAKILKTELLHPPIEDLNQQKNALWRIDVSDKINTAIFINAQTGLVVAHVNDETRWRNLLMMLHFMDYTQQGSFNNLFIKSFAVLTLLQALTGLYWLVNLLRAKQFQVKWFSKQTTLTVNHNSGQKNTVLHLKKRQTLLSGLVENDVFISSTCGGGGVCGQCRFWNKKLIKPSISDIQHISAADIKSGYRLACQHYAQEVSEITLTSDTVGQTIK